MIEFFLTMPISSSRPIIEKMLRLLPVPQSAKAAPATDSGRIVSTVTGCRNELNCEARTMYATMMPRKSAKSSDDIDSRKATLAPPSTTRMPTGAALGELLDLGERLVLRRARGDVGEDRDRALAVAAGDRLQRRALLGRHQRRERHELARRGPHAQAREILRARALVGEQAQADVEAPPAGAVLADAHAADERVERGRDVVDRDAEVGGAGAVGDDAQLGLPELVVGVEVDHEARLRELALSLVAASLDQLVPVRAAHRELDREAALGGEALLREILDDRAQARVGVELLADIAAELGLRRLALAGRHEGDERDPAVDAAAAEAADDARTRGHLGAREQDSSARA